MHNYRKRHRLRPLNQIYRRTMRHLAISRRSSLVTFRVRNRSQNRSRKHNHGSKIELERYIFSLPLLRVLNAGSIIAQHPLCTRSRQRALRNCGPTLEITFATYCDNLSHYDESWMTFFLLTQEIPIGSQNTSTAAHEIEISPRASKTSKMDSEPPRKSYVAGFRSGKQK